ncbi:MAG: chemotaxis response regulator protein-glutamate methylesterase, partial [Calditerrivibrio sp.]
MSIKVLVVDDSAFMRKAIENMLKKEPNIEVIGFARNGVEAIDMV